MSANCIEALHELGYKIHFQGIFDFFVVLAALVDLCIMRPINLVGGADGSTASDAFSAFRVLQLFRLARKGTQNPVWEIRHYARKICYITSDV